MGLVPGWLLCSPASFYLYVSPAKRVLGCVVAEPIKEAHPVVPRLGAAALAQVRSACPLRAHGVYWQLLLAQPEQNRVPAMAQAVWPASHCTLSRGLWKGQSHVPAACLPACSCGATTRRLRRAVVTHAASRTALQQLRQCCRPLSGPPPLSPSAAAQHAQQQMQRVPHPPAAPWQRSRLAARSLQLPHVALHGRPCCLLPWRMTMSAAQTVAQSRQREGFLHPPACQVSNSSSPQQRSSNGAHGHPRKPSCAGPAAAQRQQGQVRSSSHSGGTTARCQPPLGPAPPLLPRLLRWRWTARSACALCWACAWCGYLWRRGGGA